MKKQHLQIRLAVTLAVMCIAIASSGNDAPTSTSVLGVTGEVKSGDAALAKGAALKLGQPVQTSHNSGVILSPAPGQTVFVDEDSQVKLLTTEFSEDNGPVRNSSVFLGGGHLHSTVAEAKQGRNTHEVRTPCGRLTSNDGSWSTWSTAGSDGITQHAAVYHGTVTLNRSSQVVPFSEAASGAPAGGGSVRLTEGMVATWKCDDADGAVSVVDLRTGRLITFINGVEISSVAATPRQLMEAKMLFQEGAAPFLATAADASRIQFGQLLSEINKTLASNMLPIIPETSEWQLFPDWFRDGTRVPSDLASPEQPPP